MSSVSPQRLTSEDLVAQMPFVWRLTDFDPRGVLFEISNEVELHRVIGHGGETEYTRAMLAALRPDDVFFDIGTNVGLVALHAASVCQTFAFEPDPEFAQRFGRNCSLNRSRRVMTLQVAVADADGEVTLYTDGSAGNSPSLVHQRGEKGAVRVPARSLDSLIGSGMLPVPTVLKLDIEGAEILALRGAEGLLSSEVAPRALFIEIHDTFLPGFGSSGDEVRDLLAQHGYRREAYRAPRAGQHHLILERDV